MRIRITCINKDNGNHANPHEAISRFGWVEDGTTQVKHSTLSQMVEFLGNKLNSAYVSSGNVSALCYINKSAYGNLFIQTYSDNRWQDNLLNLPECKNHA